MKPPKVPVRSMALPVLRSKDLHLYDPPRERGFFSKEVFIRVGSQTAKQNITMKCKPDCLMRYLQRFFGNDFRCGNIALISSSLR